MNRRELLALFGAGGAAVPLIGGVPKVDAAARLVEPAKVEPIGLTDKCPPPVIGDAMHSYGTYHVTLTRVADQGPGNRFCETCTFYADRLETRTSYHVKEIRGAFQYPVEVALDSQTMEFMISGRMIANEAGELMRLLRGKLELGL